jgi:hypothetical protein
LLARLGPDLGKRLPESERTVGDREFRSHRKSTSLAPIPPNRAPSLIQD